MASAPHEIDLADPARVAAAETTRRLVANLDDLLAKARLGGGERALERHRARGKLTARERVELLADPGSALLELSPLAAHGMYGSEVPGAGIVTAIVRVCGRTCMVVANDATVKGGTYFPVSARKHLRAQEIALENRLPCIYLADSGGAHLPLQAEMFADRDHGGRMFFNQARMSALGIPQVACVMGSCTAGGAYVPAMCDEAVIVEDTGTIFLGGPPLVKAATGEDVTAEELGGADVHARISGTVDHRARDDRHALEIVREIVAATPAIARGPASEPAPPTHDPEELDALVRAAGEAPLDPRAVIDRIVDAGSWHGFKAGYGDALTCGLARVYGFEVGIVASHGALDGASARKGAHLVELCARRAMPMVFLVDTHDAGRGGADDPARARLLAPLATAVASAGVPLLAVVTGDACGVDAHALPLRPMQPRLLWLWPGARIGLDVAAAEPFDALHSTARVWDDGVITPRVTRDVLALGLAAIATPPGTARGAAHGAAGIGVLRM